MRPHSPGQQKTSFPPHVEIISEGHDVSFEDSWYDITDASHFWMQWRFRELERVLKHNGPNLMVPLRALDIGGGHGILRSQIEANSEWSVDLAEVNSVALQASCVGRGRTLLYDVTREERTLVSRYDVVFLFDVIEHLPDPRQLLCSAVRHLKPGGWLIVNVPACQALYSAYDKVIGHYRSYDRSRLATELQRSDKNLQMMYMHYWGGSMLPVLLARTLVLGKTPPESKMQRIEMVRRGIEAPSRLAHAVLNVMMCVETAISLPLPFGTSLMAIARLSNN